MSASISISLVILVWTTTIITHVANNVATTVALVAESQSSWSLDQELKALNKTGWWWPRLSEESTLSPCQWRGIVCNVGGSVKEINLIDWYDSSYLEYNLCIFNFSSFQIWSDSIYQEWG